ncbi:hypothetical protein EC957_011057 [Mortierella hygrophila]|uniref:Uncharacterized protein n=1 Tax=Mortierella hygrophila TaxID=979708 RepID=A0A9P6K4D2_9FUNG|nr:hypothetical protein EC957_011057 [Mortierella hygrophila]
MSDLKTLSLGVVGDVTARELVNCRLCCYTPEPDSFMGVVINGTHMINGTQITPVTPTTSGYLFENKENNTTDLILPCGYGQTSFTDRSASSSQKK